MWPGNPRTIVDAYQQMSNVRSKDLENALNQIKLRYAPRMAQQAADLGQANVTIKQSDAAYEPRMNAAELQYKYLNNQKVNIDNAIQSVHFKYLPQTLQAELKLKKAQTDALLAKANKGQGGYDPNSGVPTQAYNIPGAAPANNAQNNNVGMPAQSNPQDTSQDSSDDSSSDDGSVDDGSNQDNTPSSSDSNGAQNSIPFSVGAPMPASAPKNAPNILLPAGVTTRGGPEALYNPRTKESFTVLTPTGRTQLQNQVAAIKQAIPLLKATEKYGTVGRYQSGGASRYWPEAWGGTSIDNASNYDMTKNAAIEHVMAATTMPKTNETTDRLEKILARREGESRENYSRRIDAFIDKLKHLQTQKNKSLKIGAINVNEDTGPSFLMNESDKAKNAGTVDVISPAGVEGTIPAKNLEKALARGYKRK